MVAESLRRGASGGQPLRAQAGGRGGGRHCGRHPHRYQRSSRCCRRAGAHLWRRRWDSASLPSPLTPPRGSGMAPSSRGLLVFIEPHLTIRPVPAFVWKLLPGAWPASWRLGFHSARISQKTGRLYCDLHARPRDDFCCHVKIGPGSSRSELRDLKAGRCCCYQSDLLGGCRACAF